MTQAVNSMPVLTEAEPDSIGGNIAPPVTHAWKPVRLQRPVKSIPNRLVWHYVIPITLMHVLALAAVIPFFWSWTGFWVMFVGLWVYGSFGINLCYHRLLAHRAFKCPRWVERTLVFIALCCLEDAPGRWVATHRLHHKVSDEQEDPHSPFVSFWWSHVGWLMVENRGLHNVSSYERYARDILRDPFYLKLERRLLPIWIYLTHALAHVVVGYVIGWAMDGHAAGVQLGLSLLVWGVFVRTVMVWHITWSVNSLTHLFGYRSHETGEGSRNNWFVALISNGEGWHNNHHHQPASACNRNRWWEYDGVYMIVLVLEKLGLAWNVVRPKQGK